MHWVLIHLRKESHFTIAVSHPCECTEDSSMTISFPPDGFIEVLPQLSSHQHLQLWVDNPWMATNAGLEAALSQTATCKSLLLTGNEAEARSPRSASRQPCIKSAASPQCLQWSVQLVSGTFCIIINTYIINLVLGANRQQRLIRMTKTSNHERKMTAPAQFLFQCAPLIALTTQLLKGSQAPKWNDDTSARLQFRGSWHSLQTVRLALMSREADADLHLLCPGTLMLSVLGSLWLQRGGGNTAVYWKPLEKQ